MGCAQVTTWDQLTTGRLGGRLIGHGQTVRRGGRVRSSDLIGARGLVQRTPDSRDRRKTIVSLTDPGRSAYTVREQPVIDRMVQAVASGYTAAERRRLAAAVPLLERLADLL